jgi:hypothetical protein
VLKHREQSKQKGLLKRIPRGMNNWEKFSFTTKLHSCMREIVYPPLTVQSDWNNILHIFIPKKEKKKKRKKEKKLGFTGDVNINHLTTRSQRSYIVEGKCLGMNYRKKVTTFELSTYYSVEFLRDFQAIPAHTLAFTSGLALNQAFSARRWFCLMFFALFGAKRSSLEMNARRKRSATDIPSSVVSSVLLDPVFWNLVELTTAQAFGSMSSRIKLSSTTPGCAPRGTIPYVLQENIGFMEIRGHSVVRISLDLLSIPGCTQTTATPNETLTTPIV